MYREITIDGKEVKLMANAATPFRFKQIFGKDLLRVFGDEKKAEEEGVEMITRLAYVMANQAEKVDMTTLNEEKFIDWLEEFGPMAFINASEDIMNVYLDAATGSATP